jgi:hypothetical protein
MGTQPRLRAFGLLFLALLFVLPCCLVAGGGSVGNPGGIEGVVTLGPLQPGPIRPGDRPRERPFEATIRVVPLGGEGARKRGPLEVRSDAEGKFRIELPAGRYRLEPQGGTTARWPFARPVDVAVEKGKMTRVEIHYDSGIR